MTISLINQVYGIRISREKFYRWLLNNKYHVWYNEVEKTFTGNEFEKYIEMIENNKLIDEYLDLHNMITSNLAFTSQNNKDAICILEITHDTGSEDLIIGIIMSTINIEGLNGAIVGENRGFYVDPEFQLKIPFNINIKECQFAFDNLIENELIKNYNELNMYLVQNDCYCCS